jgi:hypothetical protein
MKLAKLVIMLTVAVLILYSASLVPRGSAEEHNPSVRIYDSTFTTETDYFTTCPVTIGISTKSSIGPYDVLIVEPNGITTHTIATGVPGDGTWHNFTYTCSKTGQWEAKAGSVTIKYGVGSFLVILEGPLGVATALTACFTALGIKQLRPNKKKETSKR